MSKEQAREEQDTMRSDVLSGVSWKMMAQVTLQGVNFLTMVALARIVRPDAFGLLGMATILTALILRFNELGLSSAIVQRKSLEARHLSAVFWAILLIGLLSQAAASIAAPFFAAWMRQPALGGVVIASSLGFLITSVSVVHRALLTREMRFDRIALADVYGAVCYAVVAVGLARAGLGVWSLVLGGLVQMSATTIALWVYSSWRPALVFERQALGDLMSFGGPAWTSGLLAYARENIDYLAVGRFLGASSLGYYTMAFNVASIPRSRLASMIAEVTFPAFSRAQDDRDRVGRAYLKVTRYISLVAFPLLIGLAALTREFVLVVFGPAWLPVAGPLQVLAIAGLLTSVMETARSVFLAMNRPGLHLRISVVSTIFFVAFVLFGVGFGLMGVALAVLVHAGVFFFVIEYFVCHTLRVRLTSFFAAVGPPALGGVATGLAVLGCRSVAGYLGLPDALTLLISIAIGVLVYVGAMLSLRVPELGEALGTARDLWRGGLVTRPGEASKDRRDLATAGTEVSDSLDSNP